MTRCEGPCAGTLNEAGSGRMEAGSKLVFHPHCLDAVEREPESKNNGLLPTPSTLPGTDTGHASLGGIDPEKCLRDDTPASPRCTERTCEPKYSAGTVEGARAQRRGKHNRVNCTNASGRVVSIFPRFSTFCASAIYDGSVTLDFDVPRPGEGTVEKTWTTQEISGGNAEGDLSQRNQTGHGR